MINFSSKSEAVFISNHSRTQEPRHNYLYDNFNDFQSLTIVAKISAQFLDWLMATKDNY